MNEKYPDLNVDKFRAVLKQPTHGNTKIADRLIPIEKVNEHNIKHIDIP